MRKTILASLGILTIVGAIFLGKYLIDKNQKPKTVFVENVVNKEIPIILSVSGVLAAKNKIEIYSEVQGVLQTSNKFFKPGTIYTKGETLLSVNSDEFTAGLQSQKSNLFNLVTSILPDIRLDFPSEFTKWQSYLQSFDINKGIPKLPVFSSDKEKYFISGITMLKI